MEEEKKEQNQLPVMETTTDNEMVISVKGKDDRVYRFHVPFNSPLADAYNAGCNVANEIARLFNEAVKKQKEDKEKEAE
jgi:hypothetical protein